MLASPASAASPPPRAKAVTPAGPSHQPVGHQPGAPTVAVGERVDDRLAVVEARDTVFAA